jgi:hypothetical protein
MRMGTDFVRGTGADELFARSGAGHRPGTIVGISARPDQRQIADPSPTLAGQAPGRGRRRDVPLRIERNRADRAVFHVRIEPAELARLQFLKLAPAFGRREPVGIDLLHAVVASIPLPPRPKGKREGPLPSPHGQDGPGSSYG